MSDVVKDRLYAWPSGVESWQDNADTTDTNKPQDSDSMLATSPTALAGELRRIKSETRGFSVDSAWQNYLGLESAPDINPPVRVDTNTFTLVGDWTTIAQVGRQVRATFTDLSRTVAMIGEVTFAGAVTTVTLNAAILDALKTLAYVEFASIGSAALTLIGASSAPLLPAYPLPLKILSSGTNAVAVVPAEHGGTGTNDNLWGGDLTGTYPPMDATIAKLQGITLDSTPLTGDPLDQVLHYDVGTGKWISALVSALLNAGPFEGNFGKGRLALINSTGPVALQWIRFQRAFDTGVLDGDLGLESWFAPFTDNYFAWTFTNEPRLCVGYDEANSTLSQILVKWRNLSSIAASGNGISTTDDVQALNAVVWAVAFGT